MAQRKPTPIQPEIELVSEVAALVAREPIARAIQRPKVPTRSRMLAERQATAMQFQKDRTAFAVTKTMEVHDHAMAELTLSLLHSRHLERGFGDDLSEDEAQFFASMRELIMNASGLMTAGAAKALIAMAQDAPLPSTGVADWELLLRLAQEKLLGLE